MPPGSPFRRLRPQLRARIIATYAIGALIVAALIGVVAYSATRSTILGQAIDADELTAEGNVELFTPSLDQPGVASGTLQVELETIDAPGGEISSASAWVPVYHARPLAEDFSILQTLKPAVTFNYGELPASLVSIGATSTQAAEQIFTLDGAPWIGIEIPVIHVADGPGTYYAIFPTSQVQKPLRVLQFALILAALITMLLGAVLGRYAARRVLKPLRDAALAARAISEGALDTRIETGDLSDLQILASSFNQMADALQDRIDREARFTSDVAHELRSPLTTLATALAVIESRRDELAERSQRALDLLSEEVRRFRVLVTDLLEISRVDAGVEEVDGSLVEIGPLIENTLVNAGVGDLPVSMGRDTASRWIVVDKRRFERIVTNLVENAERYAGGATRVVVEANDEVVRIGVEDAGPGIPNDERDRIFDRFARGSATAGRRGLGAGSGLGLALVAEHARAHHGKVWVENAESGGARFIVELPLAPAELLAGQTDGGDEEDEPERDESRVFDQRADEDESEDVE